MCRVSIFKSRVVHKTAHEHDCQQIPGDRSTVRDAPAKCSRYKHWGRQLQLPGRYFVPLSRNSSLLALGTQSKSHARRHVHTLRYCRSGLRRKRLRRKSSSVFDSSSSSTVVPQVRSDSLLTIAAYGYVGIHHVSHRYRL